MNDWRTLAAVMAAGCALSGVVPSAAVNRNITVRTPDGVTLAATLYEASRRPAPTVILLHMLARTRNDWQMVGHRLADAGIHALAVDFRGHGGSGSGPPGADGTQDLSRLVLDVEAARSYLAGRTDIVQPNRLGIAGASIGANAAVLHAAGDPSIRSLALLSVGLEYRSLRTDAALRKFAQRPALLIAGTDDAYALRSMKELATAGPGPREMRTIQNGGHGTVLLQRDLDLSAGLVDWFLRTLL
jgi:pimeloyl-ACP methyl ester carboxylesterase